MVIVVCLTLIDAILCIFTSEVISIMFSWVPFQEKKIGLQTEVMFQKCNLAGKAAGHYFDIILSQQIRLNTLVLS